MNHRILTLDLDGIGWKSNFQKRRGSTRIPIKKHIAVGLGLENGQTTYGYLGKDLINNRTVIIFYADGKTREGKEEEDKKLELFVG
jgi:hypothetical protein